MKPKPDWYQLAMKKEEVDELHEKIMPKPCPCGQIPDSLGIESHDSKWAYVFGNCCSGWHIEFRTNYTKLDSPECMEYAIEAWNQAPRKGKE